jgi:selenocysteine lyase/cysteine desulfurase
MIEGFDRVDDVAAFRASYSRFLSGDRVLLSAHSHQAWPDSVREAMTAYFDDSARYVDGKWGAAVFPKMQTVGGAILERMGFDRDDAIAFAPNTHELVYRLLTALPSSPKPRVVTTRSEFHSVYRQLSRLEEAGAVHVVWVESQPRASLAERVLEALTEGTAMLAISAVLFEDSYVVDELARVLSRAKSVGAIPLVDGYHAFNVVPIAWGDARDAVYVTAGGYKYAGFGEGVCWLRIPKGCALRPVYTGWFADFAALEKPRTSAVDYGPAGARFSGSTFDPSCIYRAEAGLGHWERFGLDVPRLRAISTRQTSRIIDGLDAQGLGPSVVSDRDPARRGGFVSIRHANAAHVAECLVARGVFVDARGDLLRLGPAPYLTDDEIDRGVDAVARELR